MRKIILDFDGMETREEVQEYLAEKFEFPDYYGRNLDALFDCLTDISEDTCVGFFDSGEFNPVSGYLKRVARVMSDAEEANPRFCVIFGTREEKPGI